MLQSGTEQDRKVVTKNSKCFLNNIVPPSKELSESLLCNKDTISPFGLQMGGQSSYKGPLFTAALFE